MSKIVLFLCLALLVGSVISASPGRTGSSSSLTGDRPNCGRHGDPCHVNEECCSYLWCLTYAGKCVSKAGSSAKAPIFFWKYASGEYQKIN